MRADVDLSALGIDATVTETWSLPEYPLPSIGLHDGRHYGEAGLDNFVALVRRSWSEGKTVVLTGSHVFVAPPGAKASERDSQPPGRRALVQTDSGGRS